MAIAFDAGVEGGTSSATSLTWSHTCTGSNLILLVGTQGIVSSSDNVTGITYNGVALTKVNAQQIPSDRILGLWYLIAPATGAHNVVISFTGNFVVGLSASYTGVKQSGQPDNSGVNTGASGTSYTQSLSSVADNCWIVGTFANAARLTTANTGTTLRINAAASGGAAIVDNNAAKTPAGSVTLSVIEAASPISAAWAGIMASIAPSGASVNSAFFMAAASQ